MNDQEKIKKIEEIHRDYKEKIAILKREQNKVLEEYRDELEKAKMEELRSKLQAQ